MHCSTFAVMQRIVQYGAFQTICSLSLNAVFVVLHYIVIVDVTLGCNLLFQLVTMQDVTTL